MGPSGSDEDDVLEIHSGNSASSSPPKKKVKAVSQPQVVSVTDAAQILTQLSERNYAAKTPQPPAKPVLGLTRTPVLGSGGKVSGGSAGKRLSGGHTHSSSKKKPLPPLRKPLAQLPASQVNKPFKMPMPNFVPSERSKRATLGPRKISVDMLKQLLGKSCTVITMDRSGPEEVEEVEAVPLLLYDPATDTDEERRSHYKAVHVEKRLVAKLRPHQRDGVHFMFNCLSGLKQGGYTGSILMDGMGLGKTFQAICTLWTLVKSGVTGKPTCSRPLILCPSSLVMNWGNELKRWLGEEHIDPVAMDDTRGAVVQEGLSKIWSIYGGGFRRGPFKAQVLVMSYTTFRMHKDTVYNKKVDLVICDEAHTLKNGDSQVTMAVSNLPAVRRLLLSGTPVQNNLSELYTLFDVAVPGLLGPAAQFRRTYEGPILRSQDSDATDLELKLGSERGQQLLQLCGSYMLRRTCGVMAQYLPPKVEQVVFCRMSPLQAKLLKHFLDSPHVKLLLNGGRAAARAASETASQADAPQQLDQQQPGPKQEQQPPGFSSFKFSSELPPLGPGTSGASGGAASGGKRGKASGGRASGAGKASGGGPKGPRPPELSVLAAITAVKKLCCHPDLIYDMYAPKVPAMFMRKSMATSKAAGSAAEAAKEAPAVITGFENCLPVFTSPSTAYEPGSSSPHHSGKVMVLMQLLKVIREKEPSDKVVLVSNYTEALDILGKLCQQNKWCTLRLDGSLSVKQRQPLVDRFNNPTDPSFILLLSSKAGGVGLNIIGANRLVLFDPDWNPANDLQAMARVWREGQKKKVFIYRLLTTGSLEEKVYQRQLMKQDLSKTVVDDGNAGGPQKGSFSTDELRALFKVDPKAQCDTHSAIKCACACNKQDMELKIKQLTEKAAAEAGSSQPGTKEGAQADKPPDEKGVVDWAHLKASEMLHGVDGMWKFMPYQVRERFITFLFSDHTTQIKPLPRKEDKEEEEEEEKEGKENKHDHGSDEYCGW